MKKFAGNIIISHMCTKKHNHMMYGSWDRVKQEEFFFILHMCTINDNHMMYGSSDMEPDGQKRTKNHDHMLHCSWDTMCDRCNSYFLFSAIFCPFTPITTQKIKISKKWKKLLETSSFYICVPKITITWCTVPEIWCVTDGQTDGRKK